MKQFFGSRIILFVSALLVQVSSFSIPNAVGRHKNIAEPLKAIASPNEESGRRAFLVASIAAVTSSTIMPSISLADGFGTDEMVEELEAPSAEELEKQRLAHNAEVNERLRRKAELQKKAAKPMNFGESMKAEKAKQDGLKMSKEDRRNALCEELGRGC
eukprot:CAMPEP_0178956038 /NCGR_PEP_ID=MMETSP0789-20121207/9980_1 /TAXON_ID=3005 /ORGANISM="Rhizosolenia setigera, Strain CCMP 1694" /LENGTH=158 /DNA_ID=CAMNT_0020637819 /DNA_START=95 /DNA_END=571 /DNA_ORIENTATION=-